MKSEFDDFSKENYINKFNEKSELNKLIIDEA